MIAIVSGSPRSGTSAMMRLIEGRGIPVFHQNRPADEFNPQGYYETPGVMARIARGQDVGSLLSKLDGRVIKLPLPHTLMQLPLDRQYLVVWLDRDPMLSAKSLREMNIAKGVPAKAPVDRLAEGLRRARADALAYMAEHPENFKTLRVDQMMLNQSGERVAEFLEPLQNATLAPVEEILFGLRALPPITKQLRTAASAAGRFFRHGAPTTPPDILADREATCRACPEWDAAALNGTGRCRKCGCSTWAKLRMATESCPLGKWEALPTAP